MFPCNESSLRLTNFASPLALLCIEVPLYIYLVLAEFSVRTVNYASPFFPSRYIALGP